VFLAQGRKAIRPYRSSGARRAPLQRLPVRRLPSLDKTKTIGYYSNAKLGKSSGPCEVLSCREAVPLRPLPALPSRECSARTRCHSERSEESRPGSQVAFTPSLARRALECGSLLPLFRLELARPAAVRPNLQSGSACCGRENAGPRGGARRRQPAEPHCTVQKLKEQTGNVYENKGRSQEVEKSRSREVEIGQPQTSASRQEGALTAGLLDFSTFRASRIDGTNRECI